MSLNVNKSQLINLELINKFRLQKLNNLFRINTISLEILIKSIDNDLNLRFKFFFLIYLFSNTFSFVHYKIIPTTTKTTSFAIKLESKITNKKKIMTFVNEFILEKKKLIAFKSVNTIVSQVSSLIQLCLTIPLKLYLQYNFSGIKTVSALNYENDLLVIRFNINRGHVLEFFPSFNKKTVFNFWRLSIKQK